MGSGEIVVWLCMDLWIDYKKMSDDRLPRSHNCTRKIKEKSNIIHAMDLIRIRIITWSIQVKKD